MALSLTARPDRLAVGVVCTLRLAGRTAGRSLDEFTGSGVVRPDHAGRHR